MPGGDLVPYLIGFFILLFILIPCPRGAEHCEDTEANETYTDSKGYDTSYSEDYSAAAEPTYQSRLDPEFNRRFEETMHRLQETIDELARKDREIDDLLTRVKFDKTLASKLRPFYGKDKARLNKYGDLTDE
jgi:hypothetical protein